MRHMQSQIDSLGEAIDGGGGSLRSGKEFKSEKGLSVGRVLKPSYSWAKMENLK